MKITFSTNSLYTTGQVRLILDFTERVKKFYEETHKSNDYEAIMKLFFKENSEGVLQPFIVRYMKRGFSDIPAVYESCSKLEKFIEEHETIRKLWKGMSMGNTPECISKNIESWRNFKVPYLETYVPRRDILDIISRGE